MTAPPWARASSPRSPAPAGYKRVHTYDSLGRPVRTATTINAVTYAQDTGYDAYGRVEAVSYPETAAIQRFKIYNTYTATGYLATVKNTATGKVYWQANARDAEGHLTAETFGNGLSTTHAYTATTGLLSAIRTGATNNVQNLNYVFDALGNLKSRNDAIQSTTETFGYDVLNRLTSVSGPAPKTYAYDSIGNITSKSDVGTYSYGAKPHAVTATTGVINATYVYDANGNMTSGNGRTLTYTSFNMPSSITQGAATTTFTYDADHARTVQTAPGETTVYLNPRWDMGGHYEKETKSSGAVEHKHYIYGSSGPVAIHTLKGDGTTTTRYLHKDHLGSVDTVTSETGAVLERFSYDAFGKRRLPNGTDGTVVAATTHHGYTGHEHLDGLGLIHMNGRVYDPALGRFAQADPYIQDPTNSQSLNRYSYVENNPLKYTDPSGYKKVWQQRWFRQVLAITVGAVITATTGCVPCAGAAAGYIITGTLKGAVVGGITAAVFYGVGSGFDPGLGKVLAHGLVGGTLSAAQGGSFRDGFLSAGFAEWAGNNSFVGGLGDVSQGIARAVIGGTVSKLGGGSFQDGAYTAAFAYVFNHCAHNDCFGQQRGKYIGYTSKEEQRMTGDSRMNWDGKVEWSDLEIDPLIEPLVRRPLPSISVGIGKEYGYREYEYQVGVQDYQHTIEAGFVTDKSQVGGIEWGQKYEWRRHPLDNTIATRQRFRICVLGSCN